MSEIPNQPQAETSPSASTPPSPKPTTEATPIKPAAAKAVNRKRSVTKSRRVPAKTPGKVESLPPFCVVLHDDEHVEMTYVVRSIVELTPLSAPLARDAMLAAHEHGRAALLVTHQERAELYQEQFTSKGLTVTIQPAS